MRSTVLLAILATLLCAACATEAGHPGPVVNSPNPTVTSGTKATTAEQPGDKQPVVAKFPDAIVYDPYISDSLDEDPPLKQIKTSLEDDGKTLVLRDMKDHVVATAFYDNTSFNKATFNDPILEIKDGDGLVHRWHKKGQ